jgi:RecA/RadA recombinase
MKLRLAKEAARLTARYGEKTGSLASTKFKKRVISTGVLALDYALGTGGWELGHPAWCSVRPTSASRRCSA